LLKFYRLILEGISRYDFDDDEWERKIRKYIKHDCHNDCRRGKRGPQGPQGRSGPQGNTGLRGSQGPPAENTSFTYNPTFSLGGGFSEDTALIPNLPFIYDTRTDSNGDTIVHVRGTITATPLGGGTGFIGISLPIEAASPKGFVIGGFALGSTTFSVFDPPVTAPLNGFAINSTELGNDNTAVFILTLPGNTTQYWITFYFEYNATFVPSS
jgi:hypothetical protein